MRRFLALVLLLLGAAPALAQQPSPGYAIAVDSPGPVVTGTAPIRVRVSGGVREAEFAAYHLRETGGWTESERVDLARPGEGAFIGSIDTTSLENGSYRVEVRVWSEIPAYDPADPRTYGRAVVEVAIDNVPPTPVGLDALSPASALHVQWRPVPTGDRPDFVGYRLLLHRGKACPAEPTAYRTLAQLAQAAYTDPDIAPGTYCVRVAAVRDSAVTETVASTPSRPVKVSIVRADSVPGLGELPGAGLAYDSTDKDATPPPPPGLGDGEAIISDGEFVEDLPYEPQTIWQSAGDDTEQAVAREAGVDPRRTPTLVAAGLILATLAALIIGFLRGAPTA